MLERDPQQPELRQDAVTGDWVILAAGRAARPESFAAKLKKRKRAPKKGCPFELLGPGEALKVIPNRFPLVKHQKNCSEIFSYGPYHNAGAVGYHDVVITRDHDANFPRLSPDDAYLVLRSFQERHRETAKDKCVNYFFAFHNWGPRAGASIYHPHYQTLALPVVPPDVARSLEGSKKYHAANKRCVHCDIISWEKSQKERIIFENDHAVSFAPYASRFGFELRVFPKRHEPHFADVPEAELRGVAAMLQKTLGSLGAKLNDPDYNFYIHAAPIRPERGFDHYHWHIEILTQLSVIASVEIGTGMEVNMVHPGDAAALLRSA